MAEAIGLAIFSAAGAGATAAEVGVAIGVSTAVASGAASLIGGSILIGGLSFASSLLQGDPNKVAAQQFSSRQPLPSRTRSYGTVKVAGPFVQYRAVGAFIYGIYHGEGPWDAFTEFWLDDIRTNLGEGSLGGVVTSTPWRNYVAVESHLGQAGQPVSAILSGTPGWDGAHVLDGCVYSAVKSTLPAQNKFKAYYPKNTWPNLRVVGRACLVRSPYDPNSFAWSDRSGPCIFDLLTHQTWGLRIPVELMNLPSWQAFSDLCGEGVVAKDGTGLPRYFLGGTYNLTDDPADTLAQMLATCDGELTLEPDGTIGIRGGEAPTPGLTITADMVISMQIEAGGPMLAAFNRLKCSYVSPVHDYQQVAGQPWDDLTAQQQFVELLEEDFSRPWVRHFNQIRRLAKIAMAKGNPAFKVTLVTTLAAAAALFEAAVAFDADDYPLFEDHVFLVSRPVANIAAGTCTFDLQSLDPACYSFDAATEEGVAPVLPNGGGINNAGPAAPAPPANLTVTAVSRPITGNSDGNYNAVFLRLKATRPADREDLSLLGRYRASGAADWTNMAADTDDPFSLISNVVANGATYEVEGAVSTYGQTLVSDYLAATGSPITVSNAAPEFPQTPPPTGTVTNPGSGSGTGTT